MTVYIAYCWASGEIEFMADPDWIADVPDGSIAVARGEEADLKRRVYDRSRYGYWPDVYLVPGVKEQAQPCHSDETILILQRWVDWAFSDWPADHENVRCQPDILRDDYWEIQWQIALADDRERRLLARQNVILSQISGDLNHV